MIRSRKQRGQAFVEYVVVVVFGVLVLGAATRGMETANCGNVRGGGDIDRGSMLDMVGCLAETLGANYSGYSFAISMSDYPDTSNGFTYTELLTQQGVDEERIDYLSDDPTDIIAELFDEYVSPNVPGLGGLDLQSFLSSLNVGQFLSPF